MIKNKISTFSKIVKIYSKNKTKNTTKTKTKQNVFLIPQNNLCLNDRLFLTFEVTTCLNKVILIHVGHHVHDPDYNDS